MTLEQIATCRRRLLALLAGHVLRPDRGVCYNLTYLDGPDDYTIDGYEFVRENSEDFPGARRYDSGILMDWFLPHDSEYGMWEGPNLEQRKALIQHLLDWLAAVEAALPA